jgi:hypothetical protein
MDMYILFRFFLIIFKFLSLWLYFLWFEKTTSSVHGWTMNNLVNNLVLSFPSLHITWPSKPKTVLFGKKASYKCRVHEKWIKTLLAIPVIWAFYTSLLLNSFMQINLYIKTSTKYGNKRVVYLQGANREMARKRLEFKAQNMSQLSCTVYTTSLNIKHTICLYRVEGITINLYLLFLYNI